MHSVRHGSLVWMRLRETDNHEIGDERALMLSCANPRCLDQFSRYKLHSVPAALFGSVQRFIGLMNERRCIRSGHFSAGDPDTDCHPDISNNRRICNIRT
jgi:hypothetical protein